MKLVEMVSLRREARKLTTAVAKGLSLAVDRGRIEVATIAEFLESAQLSMITGCSV